MSSWKLWQPNSFELENVYWKDCGAKGNCQFLAIAECLSLPKDSSVNNLRYLIVKEWDSMKDKEANEYLEIFCAEKKDVSAFPKHLLHIKTRDDIRQALLEPLISGNGFDYEGDGLTLLLLSRVLKCCFCVFNVTSKYCFVSGEPSEKNSIVFLRLHDEPNFKHYQAIGACPQNNRENGIQTKFSLKDFKDFPTLFKHIRRQPSVSAQQQQQRQRAKQICPYCQGFCHGGSLA